MIMSKLALYMNKKKKTFMIQILISLLLNSIIVLLNEL